MPLSKLRSIEEIKKNWPIKTISFDDKNYPKCLKLINNPPKKLFYRGNLNKEILKSCLAVIGSRKNTNYGERAIDLILPKLVSNKMTVVSGFMYGIDSLAHEKCLEYRGKTIAILGCGLDVIYPEYNLDLYLKILETKGLIISEYENDFRPTLWSFPQRNRIVAGLANKGILVIEASEKSGSLITVKIGLDEKRKIFCIPGPIYSSISAGCNKLIQTGKAKLVIKSEDILESDSHDEEQLFLFSDLSNKEKAVIDILCNEDLTLDEINIKSGINVKDLTVLMSELELKDKIKFYNGKYRTLK